MTQKEIETLNQALQTLRNRLSNNSKTVRENTGTGPNYKFTESGYQMNKLLLKENQDNLVLQQILNRFIMDYPESMDQNHAENTTMKENTYEEEAMEEEFVEEEIAKNIMANQIDVKDGLLKIRNKEILQDLMHHFIVNEQYEHCNLVNELLSEEV